MRHFVELLVGVGLVGSLDLVVECRRYGLVVGESVVHVGLIRQLVGTQGNARINVALHAMQNPIAPGGSPLQVVVISAFHELQGKSNKLYMGARDKAN